jgi:hypothetical protein
MSFGTLTAVEAKLDRNSRPVTHAKSCVALRSPSLGAAGFVNWTGDMRRRSDF